MIDMQNTWFQTPTLAISGTAWSPGDLPLIRARTISVTAKVTFNASATDNITVKAYYSPDGTTWDTVSADYFDVDLTAGATVQKTGLLALPEHGYFKLAVVNNDSSYTATDLDIWYSIQSWPDGALVEAGAITKDVGE